LERADGPSWQARWVQLGEPTDWQAAAGAISTWQRLGMTAALTSLLCHRIIQPGYPWLFGQRLQTLEALLFANTDQGEDVRLVAAGRRAGMSATMLGQALTVLTYVLVHTGRRLDQLTTADLLTYGQARHALGKPSLGVAAAQQLLYELGIVDQPAATKGVRWRVGQRTMAELVDRYPIACRPVRDLLVRYLEERAPAMDYASLPALARRLVGLFWCDLERHHPGISTLRLPAEVAAGWRHRALLRADGRPRRDAANLFTSVRAFYLDLAQWAAEDPATWASWVAPCPVTPADLRRFAKAKHHQQAALHARIRTLAPALPTLVASTHQHLLTAGELLAAARACQPGETFTVSGRRYRRVTPQHGHTRGLQAPVLVKSTDQPTRRALNCHAHEADAFWTWAIIEVLRLTGIRLEELLELTHLSIRHYRLPSGELVVLLQVAPSKTDRERVIPICPELAHVLAMLVARARGGQPAIPLVERYDHYERLTSAPLPYLFQRNPNGTPVVIGHQGARDAITRAVARAGLREVDGQPLHLVPHDFRRLFVTEAVNGGLPIHIAAKLLGTSTSTPPRGMWPSTPSRSSATSRPTWPAAVPPDPARNTASRPRRNGTASSSTSAAAAWPLATATAPTAPTARMSMPACAARCCAWTPLSSPGCSRSNTTPTGCWPRHTRTAGRGRQPGSRTPWATSPTRKPKSSASRPTVRARRPQCG
jgi:integrase